MFVRYLFVIMIVCAADAYAGDVNNRVYISVAAGTGTLNGNDYEQSTTGYTRIGVNFQHASLTAGYVDLGKFDYRRTAKTYTKARAYTFSVDKLFQFDRRVGLHFKAGLCVWRTETGYLGSNLGEDNGTGTFIGFAPRLRFNPHTSVFLGMERYFDINGADITTVDVGLVLDF